MVLMQSLEELKCWDDYRTFMRKYLKLMSGEPEPFYVSKSRLDFVVGDKPWKSHAILLGKRSRKLAQVMRKEGELFLEGSCTSDGKRITLHDLSEKYAQGAARTLKRLKLGYEIVTADDAAEAEAGSAVSDRTRGKLGQMAVRIEKAVVFWEQTQVLATRELRKLQRAIQATGDRRAKPVIRGLERILTRLDRIDDEAREASAAARAGDAQGFKVARADFRTKVNRILDYVENDRLIADADANPGVSINLRTTLSGSLNRLLKAV